MRPLLAIAGAALLASAPGVAQDIPAGQRPALDILRAAEVPVNIIGDMSEGCRVDGQSVFDVVLSSLNHHDINWVRGEDHHRWRLVVTLNLFGEGGEAGCAGNLLVEIYHAAELDLEFAEAPYRNDVILLRLENRFGPTLATGDALQGQFLDWLAAELGGGWHMMLAERGEAE